MNNQGKISGRAQAAVRPLSLQDFSRIVEHGLGSDKEVLPRTDLCDQASGFSEPQAIFEHLPVRERINQLTNRVVRDRNFWKSILRAYGERWAITGLLQINVAVQRRLRQRISDLLNMTGLTSSVMVLHNLAQLIGCLIVGWLVCRTISRSLPPDKPMIQTMYSLWLTQQVGS